MGGANHKLTLHRYLYRHLAWQNMKFEAEAMALLRGLTDSQIAVALAQIKALGEL